MTTSPERSGAAPWYCSHESSRAATSTMVAAGLVAAAALMACVGLLVAGDEVSALVAAMVMLVAGANTWSAGRSRTWWRADPTPDRPQATVPAPDGQGHVRQAARPAELRGVPVAGAPAPAPKPAVVRLAVVTATPARAARPAAPGPVEDAVQTTTVSHDDGPDDERTGSSRTSRTAPASATRPRRRTAPVRPVSRRVAGTRPS